MKFIKNIINTSIIHEVNKLFPNYAAYIKNTKWNKFKWKNLTLMKDPMSLTTYIQLFQEKQRLFKQKVDDSGVLEDLRARMFYEKPTTVRKRKAGAARARWLKKLKDNELPKKNY